MNFEDERYVRVYTRDTTTWKLLSWNGRSVLQALFRKVDRAGIMPLDGDDPAEVIAAMIEAPLDVVEDALPQLLKRGCIEVTDKAIVVPRFLEAQECKQSDPARKRAQRERERAVALSDNRSRNVTIGHATGRSVTKEPDRSHEDTTEGQIVTPYCAVPSRAVPSHGAVADPDRVSQLEASLDRARSSPALPSTPDDEIPESASKPEPSAVTSSVVVPVDAAKKAKRGSRLPADWRPSTATIAWCHDEGVDPEAMLPEFRDHWVAVAGAKGMKLDWDATFRNRARDLKAWGRAPSWEPSDEPTLFSLTPPPEPTEAEREETIRRNRELQAEFRQRRAAT